MEYFIFLFFFFLMNTLSFCWFAIIWLILSGFWLYEYLKLKMVFIFYFSVVGKTITYVFSQYNINLFKTLFFLNKGTIYCIDEFRIVLVIDSINIIVFPSCMRLMVQLMLRWLHKYHGTMSNLDHTFRLTKDMAFKF